MLTKNQFADKLDIIVPLPQNLLLGEQIPLGKKLQSGPIDITLSFFGNMDEVYDMMQNSSHSTRAYLVRMNGLKNKLVCAIIAILKAAEETEEL